MQLIPPFDGEIPSTRKRILDVAEEVFAERGFAGARTQDIADRANADKKLIFYYFESKEGLYKEVIRRFLLGIGRLTIDAEAQQGDARTKLAWVVGAINDFGARNVSSVKIIVREVMENGPHIREVFGELLPMVFGAAEQNLAGGMDRGELADFDLRHFMLSFGGMNLFYYVAAGFLKDFWGADPLGKEELERRKEEVLRLLTKGIGGA